MLGAFFRSSSVRKREEEEEEEEEVVCSCSSSETNKTHISPILISLIPKLIHCELWYLNK